MTSDFSPASLKQLAKADSALAFAIGVIGAPVMRRRPGGMEGLARIVIAQQLSVASAQSILKRFAAVFDLCDAEVLSTADPVDLCACGLSRPKARYVQAIACAISNGELDTEALTAMSDEDAAAALMAIKGVGPWSAAIYLLFCEGRLTVWPPKDVALLAAYTIAAGLDERPQMADFDAMAAARFAPNAGLAAHILWTYYGHLKDRTPI